MLVCEFDDETDFEECFDSRASSSLKSALASSRVSYDKRVRRDRKNLKATETSHAAHDNLNYDVHAKLKKEKYNKKCLHYTKLVLVCLKPSISSCMYKEVSIKERMKKMHKIR